MKRAITVACGPLLVSVLCVVNGCASKEPTPPAAPRPAQILRPAPAFSVVKGAEDAMRAATVFVERLPSLSAHLDIRTVVVRPVENVVFQPEQEVLLEVRSGELVTVIDGDRKERHPGDMWLVSPGSRVSLKVLGELTVLRAIYLIPGAP